MKNIYSFFAVIIIISTLVLFQKNNTDHGIIYKKLPNYVPHDLQDEQGFKGVIKSIYKRDLKLPNLNVLSLEHYRMEMKKLNIEGVWVKRESIKEQIFYKKKSECEFLRSISLPTPILLKREGMQFASLVSVGWDQATVLIPNEGIIVYPCSEFLKSITGDIFIIGNRGFLHNNP